jgi:nucleotide-binding universal stress UspA family protein
VGLAPALQRRVAVSLYRHIVVGIDLVRDRPTDGSMRALEVGVALARADHGTLVLAHAVAPDAHLEWAGPTHKLLRTVEGPASGALDALKRLKGELPVATKAHVETGPPVEAIARVVARERADLVLVGRRSHGGFDIDDQPIGGVGLGLGRVPPCDVWTVRARGLAVPRKILVAADGKGRLARAVFERASALAEALHAEVHEVAVEQNAIEAQGRRLDVDLIMLAAHHPGGIVGALFGNVVERLLVSSSRSLCVVVPPSSPDAARQPPEGSS